MADINTDSLSNIMEQLAYYRGGGRPQGQRDIDKINNIFGTINDAATQAIERKKQILENQRIQATSEYLKAHAGYMTAAGQQKETRVPFDALSNTQQEALADNTDYKTNGVPLPVYTAMGNVDLKQSILDQKEDYRDLVNKFKELAFENKKSEFNISQRKNMTIKEIKDAGGYVSPEFDRPENQDMELADLRQQKVLSTRENIAYQNRKANHPILNALGFIDKPESSMGSSPQTNPDLSQDHNAALDWALNNPNDPRAPAIKEKAMNALK